VKPHVDRVALTVVYFLGSAALLGLAAVAVLVYHATGFDKIDPSTVALVSGVSTLAGSALGALGAILASTGKGAPQPVTVENPVSDPVKTADVPAAPPAPVPPSGYAVGGSEPLSDL
jgi:hypothetical protein